MNIFRKILFPFALLYGGITRLRNNFYDWKLLKSTSYSFPVICVGNLSVGGTGKTPMIEYLLRLLVPEYRVATLSRGYGRITKGYIVVKDEDKPEEVGDEPLQFKTKFPGVTVAVDEKRSRGIEQIKQEFDPEVILLDDAFQHRQVNAGLNILLTTYGSLYVDDQMLPAGNLRESKKGAERADIVIVTKGPLELLQEERKMIRKKLKLQKEQELFFSYISYDHKAYNETQEIQLKELLDREVTLVTGVANPAPLCDFLKKEGLKFQHLNFPDHHSFTKKDIEKISKAALVLTTEKDFMRLRHLKHKELFYLPIKIGFIDGSQRFDAEVKQFCSK